MSFLEKFHSHKKLYFHTEWRFRYYSNTYMHLCSCQSLREPECSSLASPWPTTLIKPSPETAAREISKSSSSQLLIPTSHTLLQNLSPFFSLSLSHKEQIISFFGVDHYQIRWFWWAQWSCWTGSVTTVMKCTGLPTKILSLVIQHKQKARLHIFKHTGSNYFFFVLDD